MRKSTTMPSNERASIFEAAMTTLARSPRTTIGAESMSTSHEGEGYTPDKICLWLKCDDKFLERSISLTESCGAMADSSTNLRLNLSDVFVDVTKGSSSATVFID